MKSIPKIDHGTKLLFRDEPLIKWVTLREKYLHKYKLGENGILKDTNDNVVPIKILKGRNIFVIPAAGEYPIWKDELMIRTFLADPRDSGDIVIHINGNRKDDDLYNLIWLHGFCESVSEDNYISGQPIYELSKGVPVSRWDNIETIAKKNKTLLCSDQELQCYREALAKWEEEMKQWKRDVEHHEKQPWADYQQKRLAIFVATRDKEESFRAAELKKLPLPKSPKEPKKPSPPPYYDNTTKIIEALRLRLAKVESEISSPKDWISCRHYDRKNYKSKRIYPKRYKSMDVYETGLFVFIGEIGTYGHIDKNRKRVLELEDMENLGDRRIIEAGLLVAYAFLGPMPKWAKLEYTNGDATNSHLSNLKYVSAIECTKAQISKDRKLNQAKMKAIFPAIWALPGGIEYEKAKGRFDSHEYKL
jgi:hypothetical protein